MTPNLLFPFMRKLAACKEVVGFDVVEYQLFADNKGMQTARIVNRIMLGLLTGITMKRKGVDPDFIHPRVGQPPD